ncbi:hypothetical protein [Streptomyces sp. NPDC055749]
MPDSYDGDVLGVWFEIEDDEDQFSKDELEFVTELRSRATAAGWAADPDDSAVVPALGNVRRELLVVLYVVDEAAKQHLFTAGVFFDGTRVVGDRVHDQMLTLEGGGTALRATGTPPELARRTADWFAEVLSRKAIAYSG